MLSKFSVTRVGWLLETWLSKIKTKVAREINKIYRRGQIKEVATLMSCHFETKYDTLPRVQPKLVN